MRNIFKLTSTPDRLRLLELVRSSGFLIFCPIPARLFLIFTILAGGFLIPLHAQVSISPDNSDPDPSAMLDVSSTDKGILVPRLTTTQREAISNPANGLLVFDSTLESFWFYTANDWVELSSSTTTVNLITDEDGDTGINSESAEDEDHIRFSTDGIEAMIIDSLQRVGIGTAPTNLMTVRLDETIVMVDNSIGNGVYSDSSSIWQSFTATAEAALNSISIYTVTSGDVTRTLTLYEGQGTDGTVIGSVTSSFNGSADYRNFDMSNLGIMLQSGQQYTFELDTRFLVSGDFDNNYAGGQTEISSQDLNFLVYATTYGHFLVGENGVSINDYTLPYEDGTNGQVMTTDGLGNVNFENVMGDDLGNHTATQDVNLNGYALGDADDDTKIILLENETDSIQFEIDGTTAFKFSSEHIDLFNENGNIYIGKESGQGFPIQNSILYFRNLGIGSFTLNPLVQGFNNVALGSHSMRLLQYGDNNTAVGAYSLEQLGINSTQDSMPASNTALGNSAGLRLEYGSSNTLVGNNVARNLLEGSYNTVVGTVAGHNMKGSYNVFMGYKAGYYEQGDHKLYIDNSDATAPLIYGEFDNDLLRINGDLEVTGNFPGDNLGNHTATQDLNLAGFKLTNGNGTGGFTQSGFGFAVVEGNSPQLSFNDYHTDAFFHIQPTLDGAFENQYVEFDFDDNDSKYETVLRLQADQTVVVGDGTDGDLIVSNSIELHNGDLTFSDGTTQATAATTDNLGNHTATQNVELNNNWLSNDGDSEGIQIGSTGNVSTSGDITMDGVLDGVSQLRTRNLQPLDYVSGTDRAIQMPANSWIRFRTGGSGSGRPAGVLLSDTDSRHYFMYNFNNQFIIRYSNENSDDPKVTSSTVGENIFVMNSSGDLSIDGSLTQNSDRRLKRDIQPIEAALKKVLSLNGYTYYWKNEKRDSTRQIGLVAQEVNEVLPELVSVNEEGTQSLNYAQMTAVLIEAVKELANQHEAQQTQLEQLQQENSQLKKQQHRLETLEARLEQLESRLNN